MKATITDGKAEVFKPFTLNITFENLDEARHLWHRLNKAPELFSAFHILDAYMEENKLLLD